jgi:hypothetical protein
MQQVVWPISTWVGKQGKPMLIYAHMQLLPGMGMLNIRNASSSASSSDENTASAVCHICCHP